MFITKLTTSTGLITVDTADIATIFNEVKKHGFYSACCGNLIPDMTEHDALISEIRHLAAHAELRVKFNAGKSICIFENY